MNKPTAFITRSSRLSKTRTRSAAQLTPRMYYAWVESNGKEFEVGRYMTRYGALRGAVRYAHALFVHERKHNKEREAVDAADIQGLPYVEDGEILYESDCDDEYCDCHDDPPAAGKSQYISGLQKLDDGELMN